MWATLAAGARRSPSGDPPRRPRRRRDPAAERAVVASHGPPRPARRAADHAGACRRRVDGRRDRGRGGPRPARAPSASLVLVAPGGALFDGAPAAFRPIWAAEVEALDRGDIDAAVEINLRAWVDGPAPRRRRRRSGGARVRRADAARGVRAARVGSGAGARARAVAARGRPLRGARLPGPRRRRRRGRSRRSARSRSGSPRRPRGPGWPSARRRPHAQPRAAGRRSAGCSRPSSPTSRAAPSTAGPSRSPPRPGPDGTPERRRRPEAPGRRRSACATWRSATATRSGPRSRTRASAGRTGWSPRARTGAAEPRARRQPRGQRLHVARPDRRRAAAARRPPAGVRQRPRSASTTSSRACRPRRTGRTSRGSSTTCWRGSAATRIVTVATPDYTVTPQGAAYGDPATSRPRSGRSNATIGRARDGARDRLRRHLRPVAPARATDRSLVADGRAPPVGRPVRAVGRADRAGRRGPDPALAARPPVSRGHGPAIRPRSGSPGRRRPARGGARRRSRSGGRSRGGACSRSPASGPPDRGGRGSSGPRNRVILLGSGTLSTPNRVRGTPWYRPNRPRAPTTASCSAVGSSSTTIATESSRLRKASGRSSTTSSITASKSTPSSRPGARSSAWWSSMAPRSHGRPRGA